MMTHFIAWAEILAFAASLAALKNIRHNKALRLFPVLLAVVTFVETYVILLAPHSSSNTAAIYNVQVPLQHLLYLVILYYALAKTSYKKTILVSALLFVLFAVITNLLYTPPHSFNTLAYCFGAICIIVGIVLKFYEMLQNPSDFNFLRNPFFYILFAYLLFLVGTLPYFAMGNWLYFVKGYKTTVRILVNVMSVLNIILYGTYTIAFLWMARKKGSY